ncbi:ABC transporter ATP-binding protein, partial [Dermatophilus congolensis]
ALMPQSAQLPEGMSVAEYVLLGRTPYVRFFARHSFRDHAVVADVVERLGLGGLAGRSVRELSGGEAQRVMLARVLAQQAPVIVLDEPTSSLDIGTARDVLDFVDEHRRGEGVTVVAAIHDLTVAARYADRVVLLDQGRVRAVGAPAEVLCADVLSQVYRSPLLVHRIGEQFVVLPA